MSDALASHGYTLLDSMGVNGYLDPAVAADPVVPKTNLFRKADLFVNQKRNQVALVAINYVRGGELLKICATPAMTVFRYTDRNMISQRKEVRDYIINVDDLVLGGEKVQPRKGDKITEESEFEEFDYEVGAYNGEPVWLHSGAYRQAYRIHTKLIDSEGIS